MKKVMFLAIMAMGLFVFSSCEKDDDINPEPAFHEALSAKYPHATRAEWERKKEYYVADCWVDNNDMEVWFNKSAEWLMTETELTKANLPAAITTALGSGKYADWWIDDVDVLEYPSAVTHYVVEVEQGKKEIDLYFSEEGELIEERDVTNKDDTHWPE